MSIFEALILGVVQGLSEFLPISSTAHLTIAGRALGVIGSPESWTAFIAVVQLGTLAAVLIYFRQDLISITKAFLGENMRRVPFREQSFHSRTGWYIIIGTLPIATIGLAIKDFIEGPFTKNLIVIGGSLILLGIILEVAERIGKFERSADQVTWKDALAIGMAQVLALIPGSSRSGTTITGGLFLGLKREAAARFSFLLSVPAVAASGILELFKVREQLGSSGMISLGVATIAAAVSGYVCIALLLRYLRTRSTRIFVYYRCLVGGAILLAVWLKWLAPGL